MNARLCWVAVKLRRTPSDPFGHVPTLAPTQPRRHLRVSVTSLPLPLRIVAVGAIATFTLLTNAGCPQEAGSTGAKSSHSSSKSSGKSKGPSKSQASGKRSKHNWDIGHEIQPTYETHGNGATAPMKYDESKDNVHAGQWVGGDARYANLTLTPFRKGSSVMLLKASVFGARNVSISIDGLGGATSSSTTSHVDFNLPLNMQPDHPYAVTITARYGGNSLDPKAGIDVVSTGSANLIFEMSQSIRGGKPHYTAKWMLSDRNTDAHTDWQVRGFDYKPTAFEGSKGTEVLVTQLPVAPTSITSAAAIVGL